MSNETFFRMLSIALLGAVALAFTPDSQADAVAAQVAAIETSDAQNLDEAAMAAASMTHKAAWGDIVFDEHPAGESIDVELKSVREVQDINAGRFNPAVAGDLASSGH